MFYLMTHLTHFILQLYGVGKMVKDHSYSERGKEGRNVLINDALNTFYFTVIWRRQYGKGPHIYERGNPLLPHGLLFPINSKGSFICTIPQAELHIPRPLLHQSWSTGWNEDLERNKMLLDISFLFFPILQSWSIGWNEK